MKFKVSPYQGTPFATPRTAICARRSSQIEAANVGVSGKAAVCVVLGLDRHTLLRQPRLVQALGPVPKFEIARIGVLIDVLSLHRLPGRDRPAGIREGKERWSGFLGLSLS